MECYMSPDQQWGAESSTYYDLIVWMLLTVYNKGCLVQVGNGIDLEAVNLQFKPFWWRHCGVTWDSSRAFVVIKLQQNSALEYICQAAQLKHRQPLNQLASYCEK